MILVRVGRVLGPFGVRGFLKCSPSTDHPEWLGRRKSYILADDTSGECVELAVAEVELRPGHFLIRFQGFDAPEPLKRFSGCSIFYLARRGELPREEGEVYFFELPGLEVRRPEGHVLGTVTNVWDSGAHTVLDVEGEHPFCLPFTSQHVPEVNLEAGYLVTTYPLDSFEYEDA